MRCFAGVISSAIAAALLASCAQSAPSMGEMPSQSNAAAGAARIAPLVPPQLIVHANFHGRIAPLNARRGIYVSVFSLTSNNIVGFKKNGSGPICYDSTGSNVNDIVTDATGHLIVPNGTLGINVYNGPEMCSSLNGTISTYSGAGTAAATDAVNGPIVVGGTNGVAVCDLHENLCFPLKSANLSSTAGVAMDGNGNCYADGFDSSGFVGLWVYRKCKEPGKELTSANGFSEPYYGGITVDNRGNVVVLSLFNSSFSTPSTMTIYSGCVTGTCTKVGGPFALKG
ncbi:MAG: hypothetical protein JO113_08665, partial [Candidatus Eremiobacteraeota bacterium]|nr:hypothetical protein [Candidatus Eremiobacteraeota bacterium]